MSSYKQKFNKKYGFSLNEPHNLNEISKITKVKKGILQQVFNRGIGAHKSNIASVRLKSGKKDYSVLDPSKKMSPEQWGYSRIYSFVMGGKTSKTTDKDLYDKI
jgi:hypothetical protein